jgi:hypothetical protein
MYGETITQKCEQKCETCEAMDLGKSANAYAETDSYEHPTLIQPEPEIKRRDQILQHFRI